MRFIKLFTNITELNNNKYKVRKPGICYANGETSATFIPKLNVPVNEIWYKTTNGASIHYKELYTALINTSMAALYQGPVVISETQNSLGYWAVKFDDASKIQIINFWASEYVTLAFGVQTDYNLTAGTTITEVVFPEGIKELRSGALYNCPNLTTIEIPETVTKIGHNAFSKCVKLSKFIIPESVTTLDNYAFNECLALTELELPNSITTIGLRVFLACTNLTTIKYYGSKSQWNNITKDENWIGEECGLTTIHCIDGDISL